MSGNSGSLVAPIDTTKPAGPVADCADVRSNFAATLANLQDHETRIDALEAGGGGVAPPTLAGIGLDGGWTTNPANGVVSANNPQGALAQFADSDRGILLTSTNFGYAANINALCKTAPPAPWSVTARVLLTMQPSSYAGLVVRNSATGDLICHGWQASSPPAISAAEYSDPLTGTGNVYVNGQTYACDTWIRIKNDGASLSWWYSQDGENFIYAQPGGTNPPNTGFDQIGLFISANGSDAAAIFREYSETSP